MLTSHHSTQQPPHTQNGEQPRMRPRPRLGNTPTPLPIPSSMQQFFLSFSSYTRHAILHTHSWWVTYQPSPASLYFSLSRARARPSAAASLYFVRGFSYDVEQRLGPDRHGARGVRVHQPEQLAKTKIRACPQMLKARGHCRLVDDPPAAVQAQALFTPQNG